MSNHVMVKCLCCGSGRLMTVLDLGMQPPANDYREGDTSEQPEKFPLLLNRCEDCWHLQLGYCVDRSTIFDNYAYASGTSKTLKRYFDWFAESLKPVMSAQRRVLDIAANDGSLLRALMLQDIACVGVDPAENLTDAAVASGLPMVQGYWPATAAKLQGQFSVVVCMNVVAHVDDPLAFLVGVKEVLAPGGFVVVQPSQVRMIENGEFDTIYHEHLSFFCLSSMKVLAQRAGLELLDASIVKIHGDSPMYYLRHPGDTVFASPFDLFTQGEFGLKESL
ncbi:MAG: methyltransferase domain-containing protein, partial [Betaproteobacteria bacterium]|nr:methyltransferase domain-containing protein [Betaproteobacteria bacterium]